MAEIGRFAAALMTAVMLAGCSGGGGDSLPHGGALICKIDGLEFKAAFKWFNEKDGPLHIWGVDNHEKSYVEMTVPRPGIIPATIVLATGTNCFGLWDPDSETTGDEYYTEVGGSGSLVITKLTATRCEGIFSFHARNRATGQAVTVSEGSFAVDFNEGW